MLQISKFINLFIQFFSNRHRYLEKAQKIRRLILDDYENVFDSGVDMILSPSTLTTAALSNSDNDMIDTLQHDYYLVGANLTGDFSRYT